MTMEQENEQPKKRKKRKPRSKQPKAITRADGSVVRDLSEVNIDEQIESIAREVRGPLGEAPQGTGFFARAAAQLRRPVVYIPVSLGVGYLIYRWLFKPAPQRQVGTATDAAIQIERMRQQVRREQNIQNETDGGAAAVAEAEQLIAEAAARDDGRNTPQSDIEDDQRPSVATYTG